MYSLTARDTGSQDLGAATLTWLTQTPYLVLRINRAGTITVADWIIIPTHAVNCL